jgi:hypothetical protein
MSIIAREGDTIKAPGMRKDDRVLALGLAAHCWEEKAQRTLIGQRRTREAEALRSRESLLDRLSLFNKSHLEMFFQRKQHERNQLRMQLARNAWRYR